MTTEERIARATAAKRRKYEESISHVDISELKRLYLDENWTYAAIKEKYGLTGSTLDKIIRENGLHKSRKAAAVHVLATKYEKAGGKQQYEEHRRETLAANLEAQGSSLEEHYKRVSESCKKAWEQRREPGKMAERLRKTRDSYLDCPERTQAASVKRAETNISRYGVVNTYQLATYTSQSEVNSAFAELLTKHGFTFESEFRLGNYRFDFRLNDVLVEINPWVFHNTDWSPVGEPKHRGYHAKKSAAAVSQGYRCVHVWDWDDWETVVSLLLPKKMLYARQCVVKQLDNKQANAFISQHHLQGACISSSQVSYGLFQESELLQVMTFGKPRYNSKFTWELLRLCSKPGLHIAGGASRLFNAFIRGQNPDSVLSYCDNSKFAGQVYQSLGFSLGQANQPSRHWYRPSDGKHFTDNLVRQHGVDRLLGESFGKGTDNGRLLREQGFVSIYDCGQSRWEWTTPYI